MTINDVVAALSSQNRLVPAGRVGGEPAPEGQEYTLAQVKGQPATLLVFWATWSPRSREMLADLERLRAELGLEASQCSFMGDDLPDAPVLAPGHVWLAGAGPGDPGLLTLDAEGRIQRVNRAYCELMGLAAKDLLGRTAQLEFKIADDDSTVLDAVRAELPPCPQGPDGGVALPLPATGCYFVEQVDLPSGVRRQSTYVAAGKRAELKRSVDLALSVIQPLYDTGRDDDIIKVEAQRLLRSLDR